MVDGLTQQIFEATAAGMAVHDPESTRIQRANQAFADAVGHTQGELEGRSLTSLVSEDAETLDHAIEQARQGSTAELRPLVQDGTGTQNRVTLAFDLITADGQSHLLTTVRSSAEQAEQTAPTASERRLEVALTGTDAGVWEWDLRTDEVIWTKSMERLFGLEPGTFEGTFEAFAEYVHPADLPALEESIETALENEDMFQTEYRIQREDGETRWVSARGELHGTGDGPGRMVGIVTDITEQKASEEALIQQERQYRQLVERLPEAYYTIDDDWTVTFCNDAFAQRLGMSVEEIQGTEIWELVPEAEGGPVERTFRRIMETGEAETLEYEHDSGQLVRIQAYAYDDGIAAVSTDVSGQREALLSVLDAAPVALYRFDTNGIFREAHGKVLSDLGLEPSDLLGESIFDLYSDQEDVLTAAKRALDGESFRYTLAFGESTLETNYTPVYEDGEVTSVIGISVDVTELHRQRERMEFFNSILRHDVLNGMTVIKMRAELLAAELDGEHQQYAQTIVDWCDTTTEVTKRVRRVVQTLATPDEEYTLKPVDVSAILQRKHRELANAYPEVGFETSALKGVYAQADGLLADVLGNVLTNSLEHNDTEDLDIRTTVEPGAETVRIRIADNGRGIADERKESVFRRGETSHAKESGSGFGLFFVDVMIEKYGGSVWIEDSDSGGACFVIELPTAQRGE